jgi:ABC-type multidrug transport system ATPase subunit
LNAVEVVDVEKRFGRVRALAGITTALPSACLHLVSGPNGAGKSTLLRVVAGLTRPTRGQVRVLGHDLFRSQDAHARARVGYLGPDASLYPELTVAENLAFQARLLGLPPKRVARQITAFGLQSVADRRARVLSSGFLRRSGLARALIGDPDLLVLDEPWNGLDSEAADVLARTLDRLRRRGATALVAAHTVGAYAGLFDHSLRIEDGRLEPPGAA